jgi:hypothetical protein
MARQEFDFMGTSRSLFQLAAQIKGQELATEKHEVAMRRSVLDYDSVKLSLQQKRQAIEANKAATVKAGRDAQQLSITSAKTNASQIIALGRQSIKDIQDSTGNNTEYTKEQQIDIKQARGQIAAGNDMLAKAITRQTSFNNPNMQAEELAGLNQKLYLGLDRQSARINVSPLNQSNQNEIARGDAVVKPERRAAWVQAQSSGSMATIRGFLADENNVFNVIEMSNARSTAAALLSVRPQVFASGDIKAQNAWTAALLDSVGTMSPNLNLQTKIKESILGDSLKITTDQTTGGGTAAPARSRTINPKLKTRPQGTSFRTQSRRQDTEIARRAAAASAVETPTTRALKGSTEDLKKLTNEELMDKLLNSRIQK